MFLRMAERGGFETWLGCLAIDIESFANLALVIAV
jgi:hypothetical protein